jgi:hypothetical protein
VDIEPVTVHPGLMLMKDTSGPPLIRSLGLQTCRLDGRRDQLVEADADGLSVGCFVRPEACGEREALTDPPSPARRGGRRGAHRCRKPRAAFRIYEYR